MHTEYTTTPNYRVRPRRPQVSFTLWGLSLLFWLLSFLTAPPAKAAGVDATAPDLYWVIVDRSGSMGPGKGNNDLVGPATEKLGDFIASLDPSASLRMVFFNGQLGSVGRWSGLTPATKATIREWIRREFQPDGGTRLFDTVGQVLTEVLKERQTFGRIGLLVFSDGEDNQSTQFKDWAEIERLSHELVAQEPTAFMRLYSLGVEPRSKPGAPWVVQDAPTAADLHKIVFEPAPEARFKILPESIGVGERATFVVLPGPGRITSLSWDFGNGASSQEAAIEHTYTADGVFRGSLTVVGPGGTDTRPFSVTVAAPAAMEASFSWLPKTIRVGDTIELIDESSGNPTARRWIVNGQPAGEGARLSWPATTAGDLVVRLEITRGGVSRVGEHTLAICLPKIDASFIVQPGNSVALGEEITLKATGSTVGVAHEWRADGARIGEGPVMKWIPANAGLAEVAHRVTREDETATTVDRVQVSVQAPPTEFTITPGLDVALGEKVTVAARTTNPSWQHTFTLSTGGNFSGPTASFPISHLGRVEVRHRVAGPSGSAEARETIVVRDAVTADFRVRPVGPSAPAAMKFIPRHYVGIGGREWTFGDGLTSTDEAPVHTYSTPGLYRPKLTVRDIAGREHTYQLPDPIVFTVPPPWWLPWIITAGVVLALAAGMAIVIWNRQRLRDLEGRLEWQFGDKRGRVDVFGTQFDLSSLNIPGWSPAGVYTLVCRKATGYQLLRDGVVEQGVEQDTSLEAQGVKLRLVP